MKTITTLLNLFLVVGAVTLGATKKRVGAGGRRTVYCDITGPVSYTTNGEAVTSDQLNQILMEFGGGLVITGLPGDFNKIEFFESEVDPATGRFIILDRVNGKLKYYAGAAEVANATNLSALTLKVRFEYLLMPTGA